MTKIRPIFYENAQFFPQTHVDAVIGLEKATFEKDGLLTKEDKQKIDKLTTKDSNYLGSIFYKKFD